MQLSPEERQSITKAESTASQIREVLSNLKESDSKINLENLTEELTKRRAQKLKK